MVRGQKLRSPNRDGAIYTVTDEEILEAQSWLASKEGIFVEPASAASIAGLFKCTDAKEAAANPFREISEETRIVCTVTGHGLKDPDVLSDRLKQFEVVAPDQSAVLRAIGF